MIRKNSKLLFCLPENINHIFQMSRISFTTNINEWHYINETIRTNIYNERISIPVHDNLIPLIPFALMLIYPIERYD